MLICNGLDVLFYNYGRVFLYSVGVVDVIFLNAVLNAVLELKPES